MKIKIESIKVQIKVYFFLLLLILIAHTRVFSQGTVINTTGTAADPSAGLDVQFNNKGILIPRLTTSERNGISSPAEGLLIYNTSTRCFEFFDYGLWQTGDCAVCSLPAMAGSISGPSEACLGQNSVSYSVPPIANTTTYTWAYSGLGATITGSNNSISIDFSVWATSGDITVTGVNNCGSGPISANYPVNINAVPSAPLAGIHNPSQTEIIWNWNSVPGAAGYKYNTTNDYNSAIDNGTNTSYIQTGLICNISYVLYVWAYNNCGNSSQILLNQTTTTCFTCGGIIMDIDGNTYNTVSIATQCWFKENLKTTKYKNGTAIPNLTDNNNWSNDVNGAYCCFNNDCNTYDILYGKLYNWYAVTNPNGICPSGWRISNDNDWYIMESFIDQSITNPNAINWRGTDGGTKLKSTSGWSNNSNGINSFGFSALPGGNRYNSGFFYSFAVGNYGDWWSPSDVYGPVACRRTLDAYHITIYRNYDNNHSDKANGFSVRCIKE